MKLLCIHQGFPGQYKHLIPKLHQKGYQIYVISKPRTYKKIPKWVNYFSYTLETGNTPNIHPLCEELESKVIRGEAVAIRALELKQKGFIPDLILGHPGWGEMLFLRDIWPSIPQLHYVEFFHGVAGTDDDFDGGFITEKSWIDNARARLKNAHNLSNLNLMSHGVSPTYFQHGLLPEWAKRKTSVIHDGIDTSILRPKTDASITIKFNQISTKLTLKRGDPVITFVNRTFEPYRGVHIFLRAVEKLQVMSSDVQVIMVGEDKPNVSYGEHRKDNIGWVTAIKRDSSYKLDWSRIHTVGTVSHSLLIRIYQISSAHVYFSYPFVLSWSMLEAMSCGCLLIGSSTMPVEEIIVDNVNGLLVPFKQAETLAKTLLYAIKNQDKILYMRNNARKHIIDNYDLNQCLDKHIALIKGLH